MEESRRRFYVAAQLRLSDVRVFRRRLVRTRIRSRVRKRRCRRPHATDDDESNSLDDNEQRDADIGTWEVESDDEGQDSAGDHKNEAHFASSTNHGPQRCSNPWQPSSPAYKSSTQELYIIAT